MRVNPCYNGIVRRDETKQQGLLSIFCPLRLLTAMPCGCFARLILSERGVLYGKRIRRSGSRNRNEIRIRENLENNHSSSNPSPRMVPPSGRAIRAESGESSKRREAGQFPLSGRQPLIKGVIPCPTRKTS